MFIVPNGNACGAHETFIRQLEREGCIQDTSVEESDYILAFCPKKEIDNQEAIDKIPSEKSYD